jgi:hypothetical protein
MNFNILLYNELKKRPDYFDARYYKSKYLDLSKFKKFIDFRNHWLNNGWKEGRICSYKYEKQYYRIYKEWCFKLIEHNYRLKNPKLFNLFFYLIFLNNMIIENKIENMDFEYYKNKYPDIPEKNNKYLLNHWNKFGKYELRSCSLLYENNIEFHITQAKALFKDYINRKVLLKDILNDKIIFYKEEEKNKKKNNIKILLERNKKLIELYHNNINCNVINNLKLNYIIKYLEINNKLLNCIK